MRSKWENKSLDMCVQYVHVYIYIYSRLIFITVCDAASFFFLGRVEILSHEDRSSDPIDRERSRELTSPATSSKRYLV